MNCRQHVEQQVWYQSQHNILQVTIAQPRSNETTNPQLNTWNTIPYTVSLYRYNYVCAYVCVIYPADDHDGVYVAHVDQLCVYVPWFGKNVDQAQQVGFLAG